MQPWPLAALEMPRPPRPMLLLTGLLLAAAANGSESGEFNSVTTVVVQEDGVAGYTTYQLEVQVCCPLTDYRVDRSSPSLTPLPVGAAHLVAGLALRDLRRQRPPPDPPRRLPGGRPVWR